MATTPRNTTHDKRASQPPQSVVSQPRPVSDLSEYLREYAREKPEMAALWCFGIGFVLGWKLKPW